MISSVAREPRVEPAGAAETTPVALLEEVSVRYRVPFGNAALLKERLVGRRGLGGAYREHEALHRINLQIHSGETLGVIGPNGSGKTTLLRLVARVLKPTAGRVRVRGRVAPMLDVIGAAHPELTGRENIALNGSLFGLTRREVADRLERMIEFAELGDFIDAPLRTYSSGMIARLGFAVASDTEPDILAIDEALGVGDERFQQKCAARIDQLRQRGTTLLLVSHDMHSVLRLCATALWLERGCIRLVGPAPQVVPAFLAAQRASP
ncbi:MAG TPA: ABC transporter ATP-binding protein [Vicinamibacterales bacterium]|jgi:ABC-type polysaccharide/polyol phosphate transport system ATPase subunit|nr:ABC transporter ATP-binding protein [Vicinamibacterales bacterium]